MISPEASSGDVAPANEISPVVVERAGGQSRFLLVGDHAGRAIPAALDDLGLPAHELARHIACDIGIAELGRLLAKELDAVFIHQRYSRLVADCNRDPLSPSAVPAASDGTFIPANARLNAESRAARIAAIHSPYHAAIAETLDVRGPGTMLVALHSFTPVMAGTARPWHVGVLHDLGDTRFAKAVLAALVTEGELVVGDNAPYRLDATDYTVPFHAWPRGLPYLEIELRQDLIGDAAGQHAWASRLAAVFASAAGAIA